MASSVFYTRTCQPESSPRFHWKPVFSEKLEREFEHIEREVKERERREFVGTNVGFSQL